MEITRFDFEWDEIVGLIPKLTGLAQIIELEPRLHSADEDRQTHPLRTEATFRISCYLSGDHAVNALAELTVDAGVEAVLDLGRSVRFRHVPPEKLASLVPGDRQTEEPSQPGSQGQHVPAPEGADQTASQSEGEIPHYEEQTATEGTEL